MDDQDKTTETASNAVLPAPQRVSLLSAEMLKNKPDIQTAYLHHISSISYSSPEESPVTQQSRTLLLTEVGQPYVRSLRAVKQWQAIDFGWIEGNPSMIFLVHPEKRYATVPEPAQVAKDQADVLELAFSKNVPDIAHGIILPGGSFSLTPSRDFPGLWLRSPNSDKKIQFKLFAFPPLQ